MEKPEVAFNINYGQAAAIAERNASRSICSALDIKLIEIDIDCSSLGSGDLVVKPELSCAPESDWWPYRNQLLITLCAMKAIEVGCTEILMGTVSSDQYHADGTEAFIKAISDLLALQEGTITVKSPALQLTSSELIKESGIPLELLAYAHSCHKSDIPCTNCRGCNKYYTTMRDIGFFNA